VRQAGVVGTTSLGDLEPTACRAHAGWTAYRPDLWGKGLNAEVKLLLLGHAFEDCGFERVKLQTDSINERSQKAIARLGAVREGVLRHHQPRADGSWRDTVVFSILSTEWPAVRTGLETRLQATLRSVNALSHPLAPPPDLPQFTGFADNADVSTFAGLQGADLIQSMPPGGCGGRDLGGLGDAEPDVLDGELERLGPW